MGWELLNGDALDMLKTLPDEVCIVALQAHLIELGIA